MRFELIALFDNSLYLYLDISMIIETVDLSRVVKPSKTKSVI